jgi:hypothetical protein
VAAVPRATSPAAYLANYSPGRSWRREPALQLLQIDGAPATRALFAGRVGKHNLVNETVVVRHGEQLYVFSASYLASDGQAREQIRQAVASAVWQG